VTDEKLVAGTGISSQNMHAPWLEGETETWKPGFSMSNTPEAEELWNQSASRERGTAEEKEKARSPKRRSGPG
jgi:hypothetical protein